MRIDATSATTPRERPPGRLLSERRWTGATCRASHTVRPREAWRPLVYVRLTLRSYDPGALRTPPPVDGVKLTARTDRIGGSLAVVRWCAELETRGVVRQLWLERCADRRAAAWRCLLGSGYAQGRLERAVGRWARRRRAAA